MATDNTPPNHLDLLARAKRLDALKALREVLAETIVNTASARDVAALSRQIRDVIEDIEKIENGVPDETTGLAELDARRAARGARQRRTTPVRQQQQLPAVAPDFNPFPN